MATPIAHALQSVSLCDLRTKCGKKLTKRSRWVVAPNPAAATCIACKAVVEAELEVTRIQRGPVSTGLARYYAWADGPDSGMSSKTIVWALTGAAVLSKFGGSRPLDPDDFGRCYRMLKLFPELRERLHELPTKLPDWAGLVKHWSELEQLYLEEAPNRVAPKLYRRMQELAV